MLVKSMLEGGGFEENARLGAPFGQELYDYATGADRLNLWLIKALGVFSSDPVVVMNLFYVLTFPLTALAAYLCLRLLRISRGPSAAVAVLFALLPYHFLRGASHLFLSAYFSVPLGAYLVLCLFMGRSVFPRRTSASGLRRYATPHTLLALVFCVIVGSAGVYYTAFTLALLPVATAVAFVTWRRRESLVTGAVLMAVIGATLFLNLLPTILYQHEHGKPDPTFARKPIESELLALKPVELVLPIDGHRIDALAQRKQNYFLATPFKSERTQSLGLVGTIGIVWLIAVALLSMVRPRRRESDDLERAAAASTLTAILVGTIGGVSLLVGYWVAPEFRAWNRISVLIAFFALATVAVLLERAGERLRRRALGAPLYAALLAAVVAFGVVDQTSDAYVPQYQQARVEFRNDRDFVREIESQLSPGAMVFQLPYHPFPEAPLTGRMADYDLLVGYTHSDGLRWSYGAIKGRSGDWAEELAHAPAEVILPAIAASGFEGIYVDRHGYPREVENEVVDEIRRLTGIPPLRNRSGRQVFFDLRPYAERLGATMGSGDLEALREATLNPIETDEGTGLSAPVVTGTETARVGLAHSELRLVNPGAEPREVTITAILEVHPSAERVTVSFPGGLAEPTVVSAPGREVRFVVELPPGETLVAFDADLVPGLRPAAPEPSRFRLVDLVVREPVFERVAAALGGR
jgi:hypothetical protein